jgi:hypothetical protein
VELTRLDVENAPMSVGGASARALRDHRHGGGFVEQAQLPAWVRGILVVERIGEDAALEQRSMEVRDERADVSK